MHHADLLNGYFESTIVRRRWYMIASRENPSMRVWPASDSRNVSSLAIRAARLDHKRSTPEVQQSNARRE